MSFAVANFAIKSFLLNTQLLSIVKIMQYLIKIITKYIRMFIFKGNSLTKSILCPINFRPYLTKQKKLNP